MRRQTIALIENKGFNQVVKRRFHSVDTARRFAARARRRVRIVILEGSWKTGHVFSITEYTATYKRVLVGR